MSKKPSLNLRIGWKQDGDGFSLTELVVALAVALILAGIGLPTFLRAYHSYQLTNAANQMADILRLTRYEAIRVNKQVNCQIQPSGADPTMTNVWADLNKNGALDPGEKMILLTSSGNLVDAGGVPGAGALPSTANLGATTLVTPSPTSGSVQFDTRGAVIDPVTLQPTAKVNVFYLTNTLSPDPGFRAVILMPAGSIQIWTGDGTGNWQELR